MGALFWRAQNIYPPFDIKRRNRTSYVFPYKCTRPIAICINKTMIVFNGSLVISRSTKSSNNFCIVWVIWIRTARNSSRLLSLKFSTFYYFATIDTRWFIYVRKRITKIKPLSCNTFGFSKTSIIIPIKTCIFTLLFSIVTYWNYIICIICIICRIATRPSYGALNNKNTIFCPTR